jgi:hypothetical protein
MRSVLAAWGAYVAGGLLLVGGGGARADEQAEGLAILNKAIQAVGGEAKAARLQAVTWKAAGSATENQNKIELKLEGSFQGLERYRMELEVQESGRTHGGILVINGTEAWFHDKERNRTEDAPKDALPLVLGAMHALRCAQSLTALKDQVFALSPLGEVTVNNRAAIGLRVTHKERQEVNLFFDKETHLVVKSEVRLKDPTGNDFPLEYQFSDHKEFDGVKHFTKTTIKAEMAGRPAVTTELQLSELKPQDKLEDSLFAKP